MSKQKVWNVKYVAGNPKVYSRVTTAAGGPYRRGEAVDYALSIIHPSWRAWVEHAETCEVIAMNATEEAWQNGDSRE